jgi:uncharacterized tellurite resistance protein B-like protein
LSLLRFLGLGAGASQADSEPESLKEIGAQLEALPPDEARFVAAFAYLLARIAGADLTTDDQERAEMARHLEGFAGVDSDRAVLLGEAAVRAAQTYSPSDDHLVARTFRDMTELDERTRLLRCLYAVASADQTISTAEDNEIFEVAASIGVEHPQVIAIRSEFKEYLGALKALPGER